MKNHKINQRAASHWQRSVAAASQPLPCAFSPGVFLGSGTIDRKKKRRKGWTCAIDHADFSLRAFSHCLPTFSFPSLSMFLAPHLWFSGPLKRPAQPPRALLGCTEPTQSSGPAPLSLTRQSLIDGCEPPRFCHRSRYFAEGGKSRSNIFHISGPSKRIDVDVSSIHPQTREQRGTLLEHVPALFLMAAAAHWKVQPCMLCSLMGGANAFTFLLFLPELLASLIKVLLFSKQAV